LNKNYIGSKTNIFRYLEILLLIIIFDLVKPGLIQTE